MSVCVLVADESPASKQVFSLSLEDMSIEVKTVHSGDEVFECVKNFQPRLVFLDLLLPKKNGYEVCKELKEHFKHIPVVLMWTSFMKINEEKFQKCQADDHLQKPFDIAQVREFILKYTEQNDSLETNPALEHMIFPDMPELQTETDEEENKLLSDKNDSQDEKRLDKTNESSQKTSNPREENELGIDLEVLDQWLENSSLGQNSTKASKESKQETKEEPVLRPEGSVQKPQSQMLESKSSSVVETSSLDQEHTKDVNSALEEVAKVIDNFKELSLEKNKIEQKASPLSQEDLKLLKDQVIKEIKQEFLELAQKELKIFVREILPKLAVKMLQIELKKLLEQKEKSQN